MQKMVQIAQKVAESASPSGQVPQISDNTPPKRQWGSAAEVLAADTKRRRKLRGYGKVVTVEGHPPYYFGSLEQWYSGETIQLLADGIAEVFYGLNPHAARKYYDSWLKFMLAGAYLASQGTPDTRFFVLINNAQGTTETLDAALRFFFQRISNFDDVSILTSSNDRTRATFWDGVRAVCKLLAGLGIFPSFRFAGAIQTSPRTRTPVLADLSRQAGRFAVRASAKEHELAILNENTELLAILRAALEDVIIDALETFRITRRIITSDRFPSITDIDYLISANDFHFSVDFGPIGSEYRVGCAIKLLWGICYDGFIPQCDKTRLEQFFIYAGKRIRLHRRLGANPEVLNAAYHIVAIDTGWNCQPNDDLQENPFVGDTVQGRKRLRSIGGVKVRAGDKEIEAPLEGAAEIWFPVKRSDVRLSGVQVIEAWQEMTGPLRDRARRMGDDEAASRLWIWRESRTNKHSTNLTSLKTEWWPAFLRSVGEHERIGGLPITRRVIRKTAANIAAMNGSFSHQLPMAILDHSSHEQSKMYLTDDTIRALYENKMREYLDMWEAIVVTNVNDAAIKLGVHEDELYRRRQLGLSSGLDFALVQPATITNTSNVEPSPDTLVEEATSFLADNEAMENLHVARCALARMQKEVCEANPFRWIRTWLPWHAIVEAIASELESSRHRKAFRSAAASADRKLAAGIKTFPVIW